MPESFKVLMKEMQALCINVEVLGDAGRHARSAVSAASLPFGVAVEVEGVFEVR